jgi:fumarate reductase flavoprotein subunit
MMQPFPLETAQPGEWDLETDLLVAGAGGCGMVAALRAAQSGARVLLLEKLAHVGGSTQLSTSMIPAAGTRFQRAAGIDDSPEIMANDILSRNGHSADPELTLALCRESAVLVEWLVDEVGVHLELITDFMYGGHSRHRMHSPRQRTGAALVQELVGAVTADPNITLVVNAPVRTLVVDEQGDVVGAIVETTGTERVRSRKVILATSGFGANREMLARYCPEIMDALYFGGEGNTGEGILWGGQLGAATENMDSYQGHGSVAYPHGTLVTWVVLVEGGFLVNRDGRRFGDESEGYSGFAVRVMAQPGGVAYDIYDERIHNQVLPFADYQDCLNAGAIVHAASIEELAQQLHLPPQVLAETLELYNHAAETGNDPFGRKGPRALEPPFYGVQVTAALFHTQGGLKIDTAGRVLRADGTAIRNLFAGGGTAVGVSGRGAAGYIAGNGLLAALGWGKIAGQTAARELAPAY